MSIIKDFFDKLKHNKKVETQQPKKVVSKYPEPTFTIFDNSGYEEEKQKAIQELIEIQNGAEFSSDNVAVLTKEIVLPKTKLMAGNSETTYKDLLSNQTELLTDKLNEFVIIKEYAPHRAVALLMEKNVITDNVYYQTYYPENEHSTQIVVNGVCVNRFMSIEEACKNRWAGDYFFNNYNIWKSGNYLKSKLSNYNSNAENFSTSGDFVTTRTFENLFTSLVFNMMKPEVNATLDQVGQAVNGFAEQLLANVNNYANDTAKVTESIKQSISNSHNFAVYLTEKRENQK